MMQCPEIHNPTSEYCVQKQLLLCLLLNFCWSLCLALRCFLNEETCICRQTCSLIRLVLDTIGRVLILTRRLRAFSFQAAVTRRLLLFTRRTGAFRDGPFDAPFPSLLSLLGDRGPGRKNAVDHVCLFLGPSHSILLWNIVL